MEILLLPFVLLGFLAAATASPAPVDDSEFLLPCESVLQSLNTNPQDIAFDPYLPWRKSYPGVVAACENSDAVNGVAPDGIISNRKETPWKV